MNIQEVTRRLHVTPRAVRFYEEKGLITPKKNAGNGYRDFSDEDAWRLQTIVSLREVGIPVEHIGQWLNKDGGRGAAVRTLLEAQRSALFAEWVGMKQMLDTVDRMLALVSEGEQPQTSDLFELADRARQRRVIRESWKDRWNFDEASASYSGQTLHPDYELVLQEVAAAVDPAPGETGLDIGTGTGLLAEWLMKQGVRIIGIDQSPGMLAECQRRFPRLETRLGNFLAIPAYDQSVNFVVSTFALCHLTEEQKLLALAEIRRALKPHGRLCIADYMRNAATNVKANRDSQNGWLAGRHPADAAVTVRELEKAGFHVNLRKLNRDVQMIVAVSMKG